VSVLQVAPRILPRKSLVLPPEYAEESPGCGEKLPELWLRRDALGTLLLMAAFGRNFEIA
jgi:hypothetical protein